MAQIIEMPKLSDTMTEGVIAAWHKKVGDTVKSGELLAEVETDKATMELESFYTGTLLYVGVDKGGSVPVGKLLAIIGNAGEKADEIIAQYQAAQGGAAAAPAAQQPAAEEKAAAVVQAPAAEVAQGDSRSKASPLAKAMAREQGINLSQVAGSGDGGRIVKRDIEAFLQHGGAAKSAPAAVSAGVGQESYTEEAVSQMRKTIARRLQESKNTAPHFYLTMEIDMSAAVAAREAINQVAASKISFNDLVIKAVAAALRQNPKANSSWLGDKIRYNHHIHIGMAVAIDDGLVVPVIRFADSLGLAQISEQSRSLAQRARDRKLQPDEMQGNTFTISNLGMFGIETFTAIINPPDACILAVGGIQDKPVVKNGAVVPGKVMSVTLSCDHRVVDGAVGSAFLKTLKDLLENPVRILL